MESIVDAEVQLPGAVPGERLWVLPDGASTALLWKTCAAERVVYVLMGGPLEDIFLSTDGGGTILFYMEEADAAADCEQYGGKIVPIHLLVLSDAVRSAGLALAVVLANGQVARLIAAASVPGLQSDDRPEHPF